MSQAFALSAGLSLLLAVGCSQTSELDPAGPVAGWPEYGGSKGGGHYSPLRQITKQNIGRLEIAWTYHTGDVAAGPGAKSSFQATPILVEDTLYFCTPFNRVIALDAETGVERWSFDPELDVSALYLLNCRGVSFWKDAKRSDAKACSERIFMGTLDARLIALDRETGKPCEDFGCAPNPVEIGDGYRAAD